jgi:DNA-binding transcriptional regulator YhcF (GntR family)
MTRKHNRTGRTRHAARFVMLEHYLLNSPAWRSLSLAARSVFIEIARNYVPGRNGRLAMSARMLAEALPISRSTAARALRELVVKGFIEVVRPGGFNMKVGEGRATEWRLTLHKCDVTGETASRAFMRWQDGKMHFTVSPESQSGLTGGPGLAGAQHYCRKVALS